MTKQANGTGERPKRYTTRGGLTRYRARYSVFEGGKRRQRLVTGATAREVRDKLAEALKAIADGRSPTRQFSTVGHFVEHWRTEILPGEGLAPGTERWYGQMLDAYVVPAVSQRALVGRNSITVGDVESMTSSLAARGLSPRVQRGARVVLSKILHAAQQRDLVDRNVARMARAPRDRGQQRLVKALNSTQVAAVLRAVEPTRWYAPVLLQVTTGLRPGELLGLGWQEVKLDVSTPHLSVQRSLSHVAGFGPNLKAPKRPRSYRTVPIPPSVVPTLRAWRKYQDEERSSGEWTSLNDGVELVFRQQDGRPIRVDAYRVALSRILLAAQLPHVSPHALRHTYASHLIEAGVPIAHVAELLGDTVATVQASYSHVLRPKHEVADVLESLIADLQ